MMFKKSLKKLFPGISWRNPVINSIFYMIDPIDYIVRKLTKMPDMPRYSIRVRSNGVTRQFGGRQFIRNGNLISGFLIDICHLQLEHKVLEVGCGCGRTAISLARYLNDGGYTGVDIEAISIQSCKVNKTLISKKFKFEELDVYNAEYNPSGKYLGNEYRFPFEDDLFHCVFLISVFTHMMPNDVENYMHEISRVLLDNGTCLISTFLMDRGSKGQSISFPYAKEKYYTNNLEMPETAIGYMLDFYIRIADQCNMTLIHEPILGSWFESDCNNEGRFSQDIICFKKNV